MTHQISEKVIVKLVIVSIIVSILTVIGMIMNSRYFDNNCWNDYDTEHEAILNCEGKE